MCVWLCVFTIFFCSYSGDPLDQSYFPVGESLNILNTKKRSGNHRIHTCFFVHTHTQACARANTHTHARARVLSLGDTARSRICGFSHRTKHSSFTKESSPSNLAKGGSVCSRKWRSGQCDTPCKTVNLKIASLEHRWARQVAEIVFRCNHGSVPWALKDKLKRNNHGAWTRGSKESYLPYRSSSLFGELSFSNRAPLMLNTLPRAMQQVFSRTSFKKLYLELLTSKSQSSNTLDLAINHLG